MEIALWILGVNWVLPFVLSWAYALVMWLVFKDYVFEGWQAGCGKFRLVNEGKEEEELGDKLEPWHAKMWLEFGGLGLMGVLFYRDRPGTRDDAWVARTLVHEGTHNIQFWVGGLATLVVYILVMAFIFVFMRSKHPYLDNPLERMARKRAGQQLDFTKEEWPQGEKDRWPWW
jgi:hypothetical protein